MDSFDFEVDDSNLKPADGKFGVERSCDQLQEKHLADLEEMKKVRTTMSKKHAKLMKVIEGNSKALVKKVVEQALKGNTQMLKFCLERLLPPREQIENPQFVLPKKITVDNLSDVAGQVVRLVALGHLSSKRGKEVAEILQVYAQTVEVSVTEGRLRKLESFVDKKSGVDVTDPEFPLGRESEFELVGPGRSIQ